MRQPKPIEVKPGRLMSGLSADSAGVGNYVVKQDFRRVLERDIRAEGYEWFRPNTAFDKLLQSIPTGSDDPISLICETSIGNGRIAIVAGNKTTLWRYVGLEDADYYDTEGGQTYFDGDYFVSGLAGWQVIGSGFSTSGNRWEFVAVGDYLVLNNGANLPMTYNLQDEAVKPIYELREQGIACVGTIAAQNGCLCCMDISQINDDALLTIMKPVQAPVNAEQDSTGKITPEAFALFPTLAPESLIGLTLFWADGSSSKIISLDGQGFLHVEAVIPVVDAAGVFPFSGVQSLTVESASNPVAEGWGPQPYYGTYILSGSIYYGPNGWTISQGPTPEPWNESAAWLLNNVALGQSALNSSPVLDGTWTRWFNGANPLGAFGGPWIQVTSASVNAWVPTYAAPVISSQPVSVENVLAYAVFSDQNSIQRYGYRFFPSMPSQPRRFGATIPVGFSTGANLGTLLFPVRSIPELVSTGQQASYVITGIALNGGNLTANVISTSPGITKTVFLDEAAATEQDLGDTIAESNAFIEAADAAASFAGIFEDLSDDDGSRIIKALTLQGQLVIYKETPVLFLATYTGDLNAPFQFQRVPMQAEAAALCFRNTLIAGGGGFYGSYHLYAGKNAFYKFDLFTQTPVEVPVLQACQSIFFENSNDIENSFAADNPLTREIFFVFPNSNSDDIALCYDYAYQTARTTTASMTAAGKVRHPDTRKYWFVLGNESGELKRYGLFAGPLQISGSVKASLAAGVVTSTAAFFTPDHCGKTIIFADGVKVAVSEYVSPTQVEVYGGTGLSVTGQTFTMNPGIWHRDGEAYDSVLQTGQDGFGSPHSEKLLNEYVLSLSSKSMSTPVALTFLGGPNAEAEDLQSTTIVAPTTQNLVKPTVMQYYLGLRLGVGGKNNPIEITGHLFNVVAVNSHSFGRRPR